MIKHIVLFKLKKEAGGRSKQENIEIAKDIAAGFMEGIPSVRSMQVVTKTPGAPDDSVDMALICAFDDLDGLRAYKKHPLHVTFGDHMRSVRESRTSIDYTV